MTEPLSRNVISQLQDQRLATIQGSLTISELSQSLPCRWWLNGREQSLGAGAEAERGGR